MTKAAAKFVEEPSVTVVVKEINSRKVFITGQVTKPGSYRLTSGMTVLQLIAVAGGLLEYADAKNIVVMRKENGRDRAFKFNYKDVIKQKNVKQNIVLKPGDTFSFHSRDVYNSCVCFHWRSRRNPWHQRDACGSAESVPLFRRTFWRSLGQSAAAEAEPGFVLDGARSL